MFALSASGVLSPGITTALAFAGAAFLDQRYVLPHLFPQDLEESPLPDPSVTGEEGTAANYPIGALVRVPAQVIWMDSPKPVNGVAHVNVAVAYAKTPATEKMENIEIVLADGQEIFASDTYKQIQIGPSDQLSISQLKSNQTIKAEPSKTNGAIDLRRLFVSTSPSTLHKITTSGWVDDRLNIPGNYTGQKLGYVTYVKINTDGRTECGVLVRTTQGLPSSKLTQAIGVSQVTLTQVGRNVRDDTSGTPFVRPGKGLLTAGPFNAVVEYTGTQTQTMDPFMAEYVDPSGSGNVPGHRNTAYVRLRDLRLVEFGNRIPRFEVFCKADNPRTVADVIDHIVRRTDMATTEWDATACAGIVSEVLGYNVIGLEAAAKSLEPVLLAYDVLTQMRNGVLYFFPRSAAEEVLVDVGDLRCHAYGDEPPKFRFRYEEVQPEHLPTELTVTYLEDFDAIGRPSQIEVTATAKAISPLGRSGTATRLLPKVENKQQVDILIAMSDAEARRIAERLLWQAWVNRFKITLHLPMRYDHVQENDVLTFSELIDGQDWKVLVSKVTQGKNGVVEIEGVSENSDALIQTNSWSAGKGPVAKRETMASSHLGRAGNTGGF